MEIIHPQEPNRQCRYALLFRRNLKQTVIDWKTVLIVTL